MFKWTIAFFKISLETMQTKMLKDSGLEDSPIYL